MPWLGAEIERVNPWLLVTLGATVGQALWLRGRWRALTWTPVTDRGHHVAAGQARALKHARWALWKNPENLTGNKRAKLDWIARTSPALYRAYLLTEGLRPVFKVKGEEGRKPWTNGSPALGGYRPPLPAPRSPEDDHEPGSGRLAAPGYRVAKLVDDRGCRACRLQHGRGQ